MLQRQKVKYAGVRAAEGSWWSDSMDVAKE